MFQLVTSMKVLKLMGTNFGGLGKDNRLKDS